MRGGVRCFFDRGAGKEKGLGGRSGIGEGGVCQWDECSLLLARDLFVALKGLSVCSPHIILPAFNWIFFSTFVSCGSLEYPRLLKPL